jgi:serine/threonine-protein phosphatase 5
MLMYCRRAQCYIQILKPKLAVADLKKVMALEPNNAAVKIQLEGTQKLVKRIEFEKVCHILDLIRLV